MTLAGRPVAHDVGRAPGRMTVRFPMPVTLPAGGVLAVASEAAASRAAG